MRVKFEEVMNVKVNYQIVRVMLLDSAELSERNFTVDLNIAIGLIASM